MPERVLAGAYRPLIEPTAEDIPKIEQWAGEGCGPMEIARALGISKDTLSRWRKDHPAVAEALEAGKAKEHAALRSKLMEKALAGDTVALLFMLKCRHGYREGDPSNNGNRAAITINLPGAVPLDRFITINDDSRIERLPDATPFAPGGG